MNKISIQELVTTSIASVVLESCIKDLSSIVGFLF